MKSISRFIIALLVLISIFSCAIKEKHYSGSRDFKVDSAKKIEIGITTKEEIERILGDPIDTRTLDEGINLWTYEKTEWNLNYSAGSMFSNLPLINVLTLGTLVPNQEQIGHTRCRILFKDGIVDDVETIIFDKKGEMLVDPRIESNRIFYRDYKSNQNGRSWEKIIVKPSDFKVHKKTAALDVQPIEYWNLVLSFDLSMVPSNVKIKGALLRLYAKEKYLCDQVYDNSKIYAPPVHKVYAVTQEVDPYTIGVPAVDSQTSLKAGSSAVIAQAANIVLLGQLGFRSVFEMDKPGWDTWVVTPYVEKTKMSGFNKVYMLLQPAYSEARGFVYGGYGLKYPVLTQYHNKESLIDSNLPLQYEPHLEILYEEGD